MDKYLDLILDSGASCAKFIVPKSIVTAPWTVFKCQFGCENYGKKYCCPPKVPKYNETRDIIDCYKTAILFGSHNPRDINRIIIEMNRTLFYAGYYKTIAFGCGCCRICEKCGENGCNFPRKAIPSMEACGIDVFETVHNNGYELKTLSDKKEIYNCYGLILIK